MIYLIWQFHVFSFAAPVDRGFDSGWLKVQGLAPDNFNSEQELITIVGKGKYSDPEFVWKQPIGPTALKISKFW